MLRHGEGPDPRSRRCALAAARERPRSNRGHCLRGWRGAAQLSFAAGLQGQRWALFFPLRRRCKGGRGRERGKHPQLLKGPRVSRFLSKRGKPRNTTGRLTLLNEEERGKSTAKAQTYSTAAARSAPAPSPIPARASPVPAPGASRSESRRRCGAEAGSRGQPQPPPGRLHRARTGARAVLGCACAYVCVAV